MRWFLPLAALLGAGAAMLRRPRPSGGGDQGVDDRDDDPSGELPPGPSPEPAGVDLAGVVSEIWTLGTSAQTHCGVPLVPAGTRDYGVNVRALSEVDRCWIWCLPGDYRAAERYGRAATADVELKSWSGTPTEVASAEKLAQLVSGVTSHGRIDLAGAGIRRVLAPFAAAGLAGYPQVYDSNRSTEPRKFLRACVASYQKMGFQRVVPLLGASAGAEYLQAWIDECGQLGLRAAIYSLERLNQRGIACTVFV